MKTWSQKVSAHLKSIHLSRAKAYITAEHLNISTSTLERRLRAEKVTYLELLSAERKLRVIQALAKNPELDVKTLNEVAGYSGRESLCRAFRKWFGVPFTEYKRQLQEVA